MAVDDYWDPPIREVSGFEHLLPEPLLANYRIDEQGIVHKLGRANVSFGGVPIQKAGQINYHTQAQHTLNTEEPSMAVDRKAVIKHQLEALQAEMFELEQYGDDEYDENTVLVFDMKFPNNDTVFTYAAIKKEKAWFITGVANGQYRTWAQLVNFWKDKVVSIHKVKTFEEVFVRETSQNTGVLEGEVLDKD